MALKITQEAKASRSNDLCRKFILLLSSSLVTGWPKPYRKKRWPGVDFVPQLIVCVRVRVHAYVNACACVCICESIRSLDPELLHFERDVDQRDRCAKTGVRSDGRRHATGWHGEPGKGKMEKRGAPVCGAQLVGIRPCCAHVKRSENQTSLHVRTKLVPEVRVSGAVLIFCWVVQTATQNLKMTGWSSLIFKKPSSVSKLHLFAWESSLRNCESPRSQRAKLGRKDKWENFEHQGMQPGHNRCSINVGGRMKVLENLSCFREDLYRRKMLSKTYGQILLSQDNNVSKCNDRPV